MSTTINRVVLVGRLTRAPELSHTQGGTPVTELSVAVNGREKVNDEWQDRVDFIDVAVWGNQAEACCEHLGKGAQVGIEGRLRQERWKTKENENRSKVKVTAENVQFLQTRGGSGDGEGVPPDDEFPF